MIFNKYLGEFKDRQKEAEFMRHQATELMRYIRFAVIGFGFLFFLFIIPDYYLMGYEHGFRNILYIRATFFILVFLLYLQLLYYPERHYRLHWISAYELIASVCFLVIYYQYQSPNIFIQSFGVIALILAFFNIANRWLHTLLVSVFLGAGFLLTANLRPETVAYSDLAAVGVYITLVILMSAISSYRFNIYKRMQYLHSKKLQQMSETDSLTGIYTRSKFDREIESWIDLANRYNHALSIIMFDIDDLKKINDNYGHLAGDLVLSKLTGVVKKSLRKTDVFARWGGDEFAILLPHTGRLQAFELAERIRSLISDTIFDPAGSVSCSFGVTSFRRGDTMDSFLSAADRRLYEAKKSGKNVVI